MTNNKGVCKYCEAEIPFGCVRCDTCNSAWEDGSKHGEDKIRQSVREAVIHLLNIGGLR